MCVSNDETSAFLPVQQRAAVARLVRVDSSAAAAATKMLTQAFRMRRETHRKIVNALRQGEPPRRSPHATTDG
jgi:hypothetical protein